MMAFAEHGRRSLAGGGSSIQSGQPGELTTRQVKRVIFLFMNGGLSRSTASIPKPMLEKYHGQPLPGGGIKTERRTGALMKSPFAFKKYGKCGMDVSELFPNVGERAPTTSAGSARVHRNPQSRASLLMMNTGHTQAGGRRWARG